MALMSQAPKPSPTTTPADLSFELVVQIASDEIFSRQDLKDLRLVCRAWDQPVASLLFRWIKISRLHKDRAAFQQIAACPHLAQHVQHLIWHELNLEFWPCKPVLDDTQFESITRLMIAAVNDPDLFWLPRDSHLSTKQKERRQHIIDTFSTQFASALSRMPKLTTFTSCPMPNSRVISYRGYPLQADLYILQDDPKLTGGNDGFFTFMLPILMGQTEPKINSLHWADERISTSLAINLKPEFSHAFSALASIDLCIGHYNEESIDALVPCLSAATTLKNLSLCFERSFERSRFVRNHRQKLMQRIFSECYWPRLTRLELVGVPLKRDEFGRFCRKHSGGLRCLMLTWCEVTIRDLTNLRGSPNLQLESITIKSDDDSGTDLTSEATVLAFINMTSSHITTADGVPFHNHTSRAQIRTVGCIYDCRAWSTASHFDSKLEGYKQAYGECDPFKTPEDEDEDSSGDEDGGSENFRKSQAKTYWDWGKFGRFDDTYYWETKDRFAHETTCWKFTNRDGVVAFGAEPLEYFSDWDADAGDVATPTPYCRELHEYSTERSKVWFANAPTDPPPGAEIYDKDSPLARGLIRWEELN
ncbi:hypothetical protein AAE478_000139 [Parahypoxylon ruwenzoriense]